MRSGVKGLDIRLQKILMQPSFLSMDGLTKEVPIFIQTYNPSDEFEINRVINLTEQFLSTQGILVKKLNLFDIVLKILEKKNYLEIILEQESDWKKRDLLDTLNNVAEPTGELVPELIKRIGEDTQICLINGVGLVYPFLRTQAIIEALQPAMVKLPIIIFFPGEYSQDSLGGSYLKLFGNNTTSKIESPHYRAFNLDYFNS